MYISEKLETEPKSDVPVLSLTSLLSNLHNCLQTLEEEQAALRKHLSPISRAELPQVEESEKKMPNLSEAEWTLFCFIDIVESLSSNLRTLRSNIHI